MKKPTKPYPVIVRHSAIGGAPARREEPELSAEAFRVLVSNCAERGRKDYGCPELCNCGNAARAECNAVGCGAAQINATSIIARRLLALLPVVAFALACSSAGADGSSSSSEAAAPPDACYLEPLQHAPSSGACWRVSVEPPSLLVTCEGTIAANEEQTTRGPGYVTTAFDVAPGDCFGFYSCNGQQAPLPSVEACP